MRIGIMSCHVRRASRLKTRERVLKENEIKQKRDFVMSEHVLGRIPALKKVHPDTIARLEAYGTLKNVKKGTVLFRAREPVSRIFIQITGKSILYNLTRLGKRKILFILGPDKLLNENVSGENNRAFYCETIENSRILEIPLDVFMSCMERDPDFAKAVLSSQEKKIWRLGHQLKNTMGHIYMERKLAAKLWKLQRDFGRQTDEGIEILIDLPITFLADMAGAPRETVSKACKLLSDKGMISIRKKRIIVVDPDMLSEFYHTGVIG